MAFFTQQTAHLYTATTQSTTAFVFYLSGSDLPATLELSDSFNTQKGIYLFLQTPLSISNLTTYDPIIDAALSPLSLAHSGFIWGTFSTDLSPVFSQTYTLLVSANAQVIAPLHIDMQGGMFDLNFGPGLPIRISDDDSSFAFGYPFPLAFPTTFPAPPANGTNTNVTISLQLSDGISGCFQGLGLIPNDTQPAPTISMGLEIVSIDPLNPFGPNTSLVNTNQNFNLTQTGTATFSIVRQTS